jgi:flagellar biosynthetic protein FliR
MTITAAELTAWIGSFLWPFFRVAAMMSATPLFSMRTIPVRVRVGLALAITLVMAPMLPAAPAVDPFSAAGVTITAGEVLTGLAIGFVLRLMFTVFEILGDIIGNLMGLGFAAILDPAHGTQVPILASFYSLLFMLTFFALDGHLQWIAALAESFRSLPIGNTLSADGLWTLVASSVLMFEWAVRMALPVVVALLVVNLSFGVLSRASPQLNVFSVGFPAALLIGFVLILATLPAVIGKAGLLMADSLGIVTQITGAGN